MAYSIPPPLQRKQNVLILKKISVPKIADPVTCIFDPIDSGLMCEQKLRCPTEKKDGKYRLQRRKKHVHYRHSICLRGDVVLSSINLKKVGHGEMTMWSSRENNALLSRILC
jgi:hypothetical protein